MKLAFPNRAAISLQQVELRQALNAPLQVDCILTEREQHRWSDLRADWTEGNATIMVGGKTVDADPIRGTGSVPHVIDGRVLPTVARLCGVMLQGELRAWLLKKPTAQDGLLFYQRLPHEEPWAFLKRCCGNKLSDTPPAGISQAQGLPVGTWFSRPPDWNHVDLLCALCGHLRHTDRRWQGWACLRDRLWLLGSQAADPFEASDWGETDTGLDIDLFSERPRPCSRLDKALPARDLGAFLTAFLAADRLTFRHGDVNWPRLPLAVCVDGTPCFCEAIHCTLTAGEADALSGVMTLTLRPPTRPAPPGAFRELEIPAVFAGWHNAEWAQVKPVGGRGWQLVRSWVTDPDLAGEGLLTRLYTIAHVQGNRRAGLFVNYEAGHLLPLDLRPGQAPRVVGVPQLQGDITTGSEVELHARHLDARAQEKLHLEAGGKLTLAEGAVTLAGGDVAIERQLHVNGAVTMDKTLEVGEP